MPRLFGEGKSDKIIVMKLRRRVFFVFYCNLNHRFIVRIGNRWYNECGNLMLYSWVSLMEETLKIKFLYGIRDTLIVDSAVPKILIVQLKSGMLDFAHLFLSWVKTWLLQIFLGLGDGLSPQSPPVTSGESTAWVRLLGGTGVSHRLYKTSLRSLTVPV